MLTDQDIQKLSTVFATKSDIDEIKVDIRNLKESIDGLTTAIDGIAKVLDDLRTENASIKMQLDRHEKWIKEIAEKKGISLKY